MEIKEKIKNRIKQFEVWYGEADEHYKKISLGSAIQELKLCLKWLKTSLKDDYENFCKGCKAAQPFRCKDCAEDDYKNSCKHCNRSHWDCECKEEDCAK